MRDGRAIRQRAWPFRSRPIAAADGTHGAAGRRGERAGGGAGHDNPCGLTRVVSGMGQQRPKR